MPVSVATNATSLLEEGGVVYVPMTSGNANDQSTLRIYARSDADKMTVYDEITGDIRLSIASTLDVTYVDGMMVLLIDGRKNGFQSSQLEIYSTVDHVYRFWDESLSAHFYTSSFSERNSLIQSNPDWAYEGAAYEALTVGDTAVTPTYRFWSPTYQNHFYTNSIAERDHIQTNDPNWTYEGEDFAVRTSAATGFTPVYRFYSETFNGHFYTPSESERDLIQANDANWAYEGVAWYAPE